MKFRMILALLAIVGLIAQPALAQQAVGGRVVSGSPGYVVGDTRPITLDTGGNLRVVTTGSTATGASATQVQGTSASGATAVGNPIGSACIYSSTLPTLTNGWRNECQVGARGQTRVLLHAQNVVGADDVNNGNLASVLWDSEATGTSPRPLSTMTYLWDGTNFDRQTTIPGSTAAGVGVAAVAISPHSVAGGAIAPTATSAAASALVVKASAGNLYEWRVVAGASAGYVLLFNATAAPADGAVTPVDCVPVAANAGVGSGTTIPERYSTGIVIVFSTTGCFTKTASATAFIRARAL